MATQQPKSAAGGGRQAKRSVAEQSKAASGGADIAIPFDGARSGGGLFVSQTRRQIEAYNFTKSDLDLIGTNSVSAAVCFSAASALAGLWIDVNKDVMFAVSVPPAAQAMQSLVNVVGLPAAIGLVALGFYFVWRRSSVINRVKSESQNMGIDSP